MATLYLTNSLSRKKEKFEPLNSSGVGMYTCGPTVYDVKHIGNFRTYTLSDLLYRVLVYCGYNVNYIMNFTDVGHLTGDNEGDSDTGEDRLVKAAKRDKKTAWEVAKHYTELFITDFEKLNLIKPNKWVSATDHIPEQIELIKKLEQNGLVYLIPDSDNLGGVYFDTVSYEKKGYKYGELSDLDQLKVGARVEPNRKKKNPRDFALWRFSPKGTKRDMEWESPWGVGFPGWHIECSAMSMKYLGETFDLHIGGDDIRSTHHPNEIAQSQGATHKQFVKYWVHGALILIDGARMSTSKGNNFKIRDIIKKGYDPLALRYLYFSTHYRQILNFTWDSLSSAQKSLENLRDAVLMYKNPSRTVLSAEKREKADAFSEEFIKAISDDLNMPQALSVVWKVVKSNIPSEDKYDLLMTFDEVLGFGLSNIQEKKVEIPEEIKTLILKREEARKQNDFKKADFFRQEIESKGFFLEDLPGGVRVKAK